jgi:hypothetical protein
LQNPPNRCKIRQNPPKSAKSLRFVANRCALGNVGEKSADLGNFGEKSADLGNFGELFLQLFLKDLLIPYYIFRRNVATDKTFAGQVKPGIRNLTKVQKVPQSATICNAKTPTEPAAVPTDPTNS